MMTGTPEWLAKRREGITSTDIPALLGISPWDSEGDIARKKLGDDTREVTRRMRLGSAMESVVAGEDAIEHGLELRHVPEFIVQDWRMTSLDYERVTERCIVEIKTSTSRDWDDGLPDYIEAQVRGQMGVAEYPRAHIAALRYGSELVCFDIEHDPGTYDGLVMIADDFRRRLAAGGPYTETRESGRRAWPADDGETIDADSDVIEAVGDLLETRTSLGVLTEREDALVAALQARIGTAARVNGPGWHITWKRSKDTETTNWKALAEGLLQAQSEATREALIGLQTSTRSGSRPFILRKGDKA